MSTPEDQQQLGTISRSSTISISSEIMVAAIVFFFVVVVFVFFLHIYARMRWSRLASDSHRSRLVFAASQDPPAIRRGLEPSVISSLPVSVYRSEDFKATGGFECAVCLSELAEGEKARILPKCNHGFHLDCIDMWFHSHSTCPLCRRPVGPDGDPDAGAGDETSPPPEVEVDLTVDLTGSPNLPTNVLFWGTQDQVSTLTSSQEAASAAAATATSGPSSSSPGKLDGALVIEIPPRAAVELACSSPHSPLPSSKFPVEDWKSPSSAAPTPTRLRTLRRILSREKRVAGPSSSPRGAGDIEQGIVGTAGVVPRTPTSSGKN